VGSVDFRYTEVEDGTRMIKLRGLGFGPASTVPSAVRRGPSACSEQQRQSQYITIECRGALQSWTLIAIWPRLVIPMFLVVALIAVYSKPKLVSIAN